MALSKCCVKSRSFPAIAGGKQKLTANRFSCHWNANRNQREMPSVMCYRSFLRWWGWCMCGHVWVCTGQRVDREEAMITSRLLHKSRRPWIPGFLSGCCLFPTRMVLPTYWWISFLFQFSQKSKQEHDLRSSAGSTQLLLSSLTLSALGSCEGITRSLLLTPAGTVSISCAPVPSSELQS